MRICLVTSSYARFEDDGNARFVRSIAEAQATLGHEVHVLAPYTPQVRPYVSQVRVHWFKYVWPTRWGVMGHAAALENDRKLRGAAVWQAPLFAISLAFHLQRLILRYRFDILHAHWVIPSGVLVSWAARLNHKPFFISLHGSDMYLAQHRALWGYMARSAFRCAYGITACSQPLADAAVHIGAPLDRVRIIPWGADPARFVVADDVPDLRRKLGLPIEASLVLAAGRLVAKKGFAQLIRAMPSVLAIVPDVYLIIVGEGVERDALEYLIGELNLLGKVLLTGAVAWPDMPSYLAASDVFVMPSVHDVSGNLDGLPTVILEAMAASKPVVATHMAGVPLVVSEYETGILVEEASPTQLSAALIRLLSSDEERQRMGKAARRRVENELNWLEVAHQFDRLYASSPPQKF